MVTAGSGQEGSRGLCHRSPGGDAEPRQHPSGAKIWAQYVWNEQGWGWGDGRGCEDMRGPLPDSAPTLPS